MMAGKVDLRGCLEELNRLKGAQIDRYVAEGVDPDVIEEFLEHTQKDGDVVTKNRTMEEFLEDTETPDTQRDGLAEEAHSTPTDLVCFDTQERKAGATRYAYSISDTSNENVPQGPISINSEGNQMVAQAWVNQPVSNKTRYDNAVDDTIMEFLFNVEEGGDATSHFSNGDNRLHQGDIAHATMPHARLHPNPHITMPTGMSGMSGMNGYHGGMPFLGGSGNHSIGGDIHHMLPHGPHGGHGSVVGYNAIPNLGMVAPPQPGGLPMGNAESWRKYLAP